MVAIHLGSKSDNTILEKRIGLIYIYQPLILIRWQTVWIITFFTGKNQQGKLLFHIQVRVAKYQVKYTTLSLDPINLQSNNINITTNSLPTLTKNER